MSIFKKAFIGEIKNIKDSYYKLSLITVLPLFSFFIIISIFYEGVIRELPIVLVDNDKSSLSRKLISHIQSSPTIAIKKMTPSLRDAMVLVKKSEAYGVVIIPKHFYKDTLLQKQPKITALINTQYILIGKMLTSALISSLAQNSQELSLPINIQVTPFFNTYQNYFLFLVSALLPSIWQVFIVIATLVSFGSMFKEKEEKEFFKDGFFEISIIAKLLPYTISYLLVGIGYLLFIYQVLGWEFQGSFTITIFGMFLTVVAYQATALLLFVMVFDYARSLSLAALYTAPAFAFLGVTFPVLSMNTFALLWRDLLPISYYIELQISQANYGLSFFDESSKLLYLFSFWIAFIPVFFMFRKRMQDEL
ncbi:MAG: ABC transporter permease [Sulfurimonas sp.]|nr:ABC transporter permease [Sulfurimonas sp.]